MALSGKLEQLCTDRRHKGALGLYLQSATVPTDSLQGKKWNIGTSNMQSEWLLDETNGSGRCTRRIHERGLFQAIAGSPFRVPRR